MMATPKAVYLRPVLDVRQVAELLTVPKKVMVCWVCMVVLLLPGQSGHIPKGAKVAAPKSRHRRVAKRRSFRKGTRSLRGGRSPKPEGRGTRVLNAEPKGAAFTPKRWPSEHANRRLCSLRLPKRLSETGHKIANRNFATVRTKPSDSRVLRYSATVLGGFFKPRR
jgi:hypothetical protein